MYPMTPDQENNIQEMRNYWNTHPEIRGINPVTFWLHMYYVHAMHTFIPGISKNPMYAVSESKLLEDIVSYRTRTEENITDIGQKAQLIKGFIARVNEYIRLHHSDVVDALEVIVENPDYLSAVIFVNDGSFRTNRIILPEAEFAYCAIEKNGECVPINTLTRNQAEPVIKHILEEDGVIFVQLVPKAYMERILRYNRLMSQIGHYGSEPSYRLIGPLPSIWF